MVVGDLHGCFPSLRKTMEIVGDLEQDNNRCVVFAGDFVDCGDHSLEVLMTLLLIKSCISGSSCPYSGET